MRLRPIQLVSLATALVSMVMFLILAAVATHRGNDDQALLYLILFFQAMIWGELIVSRAASVLLIYRRERQ